MENEKYEILKAGTATAASRSCTERTWGGK